MLRLLVSELYPGRECGDLSEGKRHCPQSSTAAWGQGKGEVSTLARGPVPLPLQGAPGNKRAGDMGADSSLSSLATMAPWDKQTVPQK